MSAPRSRPLLFLLFAGVALATRIVLLGVPIVDLDEAVYLTGARVLLRGGVPYADFADHKPPLVFAYYAAAQFLGDGMLPVRLLTAALLVPLAAFGASAFFGHDRRGVSAGLSFLVWSAAFLGHDMLAVNCELLMLAPLAWSLVALREEAAARRSGRTFAAGLLVGLAALFKYQAVAMAPALALAIAFAGRKDGAAKVAGRLTSFGLGGVLPLLGAFGVFRALGAGEAFVYWNWTHNLAYSANPPAVAETLRRAASYLLPFLLAAAPLAWAAWRARSEQGAYRRWLVGSALASTGLVALLGLRLYPHYFIPLYLPLALGAAPWVAACVRRPFSGAARAFIGCAAILLGGFSAANAYLYLWRHDVYVETRPVYRRVAERLRADSCFDRGKLFVWGFAPMFYEESRLEPASRFLTVGQSLVGYVSGEAASGARSSLVRPEHWDLLMADLARTRPAYLLDAAPAHLGRWGFPLEDRPRLAAFVASRYRRLDVVDAVVIYRRRGCETE